MTHRLLAITIALVFSLPLTACGGGGGSSAPPPPPPPPPSDDASLAGLAVSVGTLVPAFDTATDMYAVGPDLLASSVRVTATASDAGATLTVDGMATPSGTPSDPIDLDFGVTPVMVVVTAEDGTTQQTYTVAFERALPGAQEAYLKASNTGSFDAFAQRLALSGNTLVVGAPGEDSSALGVGGNEADNSASASGAAYVFVRDGGTWAQQAYLKASNTGNSDGFGRAVAIDGDTIVVGAPQEDSAATGVNGDQASNALSESGAAYVFVRSGTTWTQQAYLKASNSGFLDQFGASVAVSKDTVVVGAPFEASVATGVDGLQGSNGAVASGAAYVFVRSGTAWSQQAYLKASNTEAFDGFGTSVAVSGDTVAVGAPEEESAATGIDGNQADNAAAMSGAVYVFLRTGATWAQEAYVKASNTGAGDRFGLALAISGDTLVVGAPEEDSSATGVGGAQANDAAASSGAVYVFFRSGTTWTQQAYVKASNTGAGDQFGASVALDEDVLLVGAPFEDGSTTGLDGNEADNAAMSAGAAYLYLRDGAVWTKEIYLKASNTEADDRFGSSVAVSGSLLAVGADGEDSAAAGVGGAEADNASTGSGAAYVYR